MDYSIKDLYASTLSALYDWNTHIALDLSANVEGFSNDENNYIIENFFWFAEDVISVPEDVMACHD